MAHFFVLLSSLAFASAKQISPKAFSPRGLVSSSEHGKRTDFLASRATLPQKPLPGDLSHTNPFSTEFVPHSFSKDGLSSHNSQNSTANETVSEAKLFFLFLTVGGLDHYPLWDSFFAGVAPSRYRALMHCKFQACRVKNSASLRNVNMTVVDQVPSSYCGDLVSPMVELLRVATLESKSAQDRFIFVSESTLPVKPFSIIYSTLTAEQASDFCIAPPGEWKEVAPHEYVVKHSQWSVLSGDHARALTQRWMRMRNNELPGIAPFQWWVPNASGPAAGQNDTFRLLPARNPTGLCADEWAPFASIFGTVADRGQDFAALPGLAYSANQGQDFAALPGLAPAGQLDLRGLRQAYTGQRIQGICHTFAFWRHMNDGLSVAEELTSDSGTQFSCYPKCESSHPAEIVKLSSKGAATLRQSPFLFARKFGLYAMSKSQFDQIILA